VSFSVRYIFTTSSGDGDQEKIGEDRLDQILDDYSRGRWSSLQDLRLFLEKGLRWYLRRESARQDVEALLTQTLDEVVAALRAGRIDGAEEMLSFARSAAKANAEALREPHRSGDHGEAPREKRPVPAHVQAMKCALQELSVRDREAISRYAEGDETGRVCQDLNISPCQLSQLKARLRARYSQLRSAPEKGPERKPLGSMGVRTA